MGDIEVDISVDEKHGGKEDEMHEQMPLGHLNSLDRLK